MTQNLYYVKNKIEGMSKEELVLVVYEELLKTLHNIEHALEKKDTPTKAQSVSHALEIISVLLSFLNYDAGEISFQLRSLYLFAMQSLTRVNYQNSNRDLQMVLRIFNNLTVSWKEMLARKKSESADEEIKDQKLGGVKQQIVEIYG